MELYRDLSPKEVIHFLKSAGFWTEMCLAAIKSKDQTGRNDTGLNRTWNLPSLEEMFIMRCTLVGPVATRPGTSVGTARGCV